MVPRRLTSIFPPSLFISLLVLIAGFPCAMAARGGAPITVEVVTSFPSVSAEPVERQVTIPLEVTLAGLPGLRSTWSRSLFGLSHLVLAFEDGTDRFAARQKVIDRLQHVENLPAGAVPQIGPGFAPVLLRYTLSAPKTDRGEDIYTLNDLRALQDWVLERELRRVPRVLDVSGAGGTVKRYEVHPDPDRLRHFGITLNQLQKALAEHNGNVDGDFLRPARNVRDIGLLGGGRDPMEQALAAKSPQEADRLLRKEEERRLREIRKIVVATVKEVSVRVEDLVQGGPSRDETNGAGVVVGHQPRCSRVGLSQGKVDADDVVQGVVLLRPGEDARQALRAVRATIKDLNDTPGRLLPGVRIQLYNENPDAGSTPAEAAKRPLWIEADFPANASPEEVARQARTVRKVLSRHEEVETVVSEIVAADDLCRPALNKVRFLARLRPEHGRPGRRAELIESLRGELGRTMPGAAWSFADTYPDEMREAFAARAGEVLVKIKGPDLEELDRLAGAARRAALGIPGVEEARVVRILGQPKMELRIDAGKCKLWGVTSADVGLVIQAAFDGRPVTRMIEGDKQYDITLRWPAPLRAGREAILGLPVDLPPLAEEGPTPHPGSTGPRETIGKELKGSPRLRLRQLLAADGEEKPAHPGAAVIYCENGRRLIAIQLRVKEGEAARVLAEGRKRTAALVREPYRVEWAGP